MQEHPELVADLTIDEEKSVAFAECFVCGREGVV